MLFTIFVEEGSVPPDSKRGNVIPIYKKGDRQFALIYGRVSLASAIMKMTRKERERGFVV